MESQPQNPEFRNNLENFHPFTWGLRVSLRWGKGSWLLGSVGWGNRA